MKHIRSTFVLSIALATSLSAHLDHVTLVPELAPIIVTGDLWESELQSTTASVSLIDEAELKSNGTQHFEDVIGSMPNLTWTGGTSRPRYIQIRGIGENSQFEGETPDSTVRFMIDDFDLTGIGTVGNLFDVKQVEVLRGPQAGAFGANAAGGVVQIVSNEPTSYWTGQAEATVGNDDLWSLGLAFGGPILESDPEQLTFRFAINTLNQDGFRENRSPSINRDDTNERDELTSRLKLRWKPNDNWQIEGGLLYADADNGYDEFTLSNEDEDTFSDEPGRDEQETYGASLRASFYGFDDFDITYVGQITDTDSFYSFDSDWGAGTLAPAPSTSTYSAFLQTEREREVSSHELRFDSSDDEDALGFIDRWTLGLFYHELDEDTHINYFDRDFSDNAEVSSEYETETFALFGQIAHDLNERTRIILGLRYERHEVDFNSVTLDNIDIDFDTVDDLPLIGGSQTEDDLWGGKLTIEHDLEENQLLFASIARGYKAGGANSGVFNLTSDPDTYGDETLWNYEIGLRSKWFDGKIASQVTVFYLDREDAQLRDSAGAGGFFRYFTSNAGDAEHYGLEAEATWFINDDWIFSGSIGLLETELDTTGNDISNSPSYTYSARIDYSPKNGGLFSSLEIVGRDRYFESNSLINREQRDAFTVVNASVGYRFENWNLTLWSKNLFDEDYAERVFFFNNTDFSTVNTRYEAPAAPRTYGVTANYSW